jgi:uncharacterized membrane protein YecN with MAPEG domain
MQDQTESLEGAKASRIKKAELLVGVGALVLGMGLGLLLSSFLKHYAFPILLVGLLMHAWGMFDKHKLETTSSGVRLWWAELLYWVCWIALLILIIYLTVSYLRR